MKKLLVSTLLVILSGQVFAKDFTANGTYAFWTLKLTQRNGNDYDNNYRAVFSYLGKTDVIDVKATVTKRIKEDREIHYQGRSDNGKPFLVTVVKQPCIDNDRKTWSHIVTVEAIEERADGCGGVIVEGDDNRSNQRASTVVNRARAQAKKLNTQGFRLYKQGKYEQALSWFRRAAKADKDYVLGQYNLACTASILAANHYCSDEDEYMDVDLILTALKHAVKHDLKRRAKTQTDPDLAYVRKHFRYYQEILGYSTYNDRQLKTMLIGIDWQTEFRWLHVEPIGRLIFAENGTVTLKTASEKDNVTQGSSPWTHHYRHGRYQVNNGIVTLIFNSQQHGRQQITGQLDSQGVLHFDGARTAKILPRDSYRFIEPDPCGHA